MMAKKASDRFPSMKAMADELAVIVKNPAPTSTDTAPITPERPPTASGTLAAATSLSGDARASQIGKSLNQKALTETDVTSLEELVNKCLRRGDYEQMIQIIERIPEKRRNDSLGTLLEKAREKVDAIAFLICEMDEADRHKDGAAALRKAEELLKINPAHGRAREIQEKYSDKQAAHRKVLGLARRRPISPKWPAIAVASLAIIAGALWASGAFRIKTRDGVIVLQDLPHDAEVLVDGDAVSVHFPKGEALPRSRSHPVSTALR